MRIPHPCLVATLVVLVCAAPAAAIPGDGAPPATTDPTSFCPQPDGVRGSGDALVVLRRAVNLIGGWCSGFDESMLDVGPCLPDPETGSCTPDPDGSVGVSDALAVLNDVIGAVPFAPSNASYVQLVTILPPKPALGDVNRPPLYDFPNEVFGDRDCNSNGEFDGPDATVVDVMVDAETLPTVPYRVCLWQNADAREFDFDAPPFDSPMTPFPGPEDWDAFGDGQLDAPPPDPDPEACATVCPEGFSNPQVECALTEPLPSPTGNARKVRIGPFPPTTKIGTRDWSIVVDPGFALDDESFEDNITFEPVEVQITQCPPVAPDLAVVPGAMIQLLPNQPSQHDDLTFRVQIQNQGALPVENDFDADLYLDYDRTRGLPVPGPSGGFPPGDTFATYDVSALGTFDPGDQVTAVFPALRLGPGLHSATVLLDSFGSFMTGSITEGNESNNLYPEQANDPAGIFCVGSGRGFGSPDLAFESVRFVNPATGEEACHREVGDVVLLEVSVRNVASPGAKDLALSPGFPNEVVYLLDIPNSSLSGFAYDCIPAGFATTPLRGSIAGGPITPGLIDGSVVLSIEPGPGAPADVNPANNTLVVPMLNRPPTADAGPNRVTTVGQGVQLDASASDPNAEPLSYFWSIQSGPGGGSFNNPSIQDPVFTGNAAGVYTLRLQVTDCPGSGFGVSDTVQVTVQQAPPSLSLSADPDQIDPGGTSTLSWSGNGDSCEASEGWSGSRPPNGDEQVSPGSTTSYTLTCTGPGGQISRSVTVTVTGGGGGGGRGGGGD